MPMLEKLCSRLKLLVTIAFAVVPNALACDAANHAQNLFVQTYGSAIVYPGPKLNLVLGPNGECFCPALTCLPNSSEKPAELSQ